MASASFSGDEHRRWAPENADIAENIDVVLTTLMDMAVVEQVPGLDPDITLNAVVDHIYEHTQRDFILQCFREE